MHTHKTVDSLVALCR